MAILVLPPHTAVVDQRPVPAVVERFLERDGCGWNASSISTVLRARASHRDEEDLVLEHMQLSALGAEAVFAEVELAEPLRFASRPGDFDFDPGEE